MQTRRDFLRVGATAATAALYQSPLTGQQPARPSSQTAIDPRSLVNPELRGPLLKVEAELAGQPPLTASSLKDLRVAMAQFAPPMLAAPLVKEQMIPGASGDPDVRIYIVGASPGASKPAILHMHGGGYITQTAAGARRDMQDLAIEHDCVCITVDYRLAPEAPFPGSLNDNYAALRWLFEHAGELGVDTRRVAIKGESAGGGHAAALAIAVRDRAEFPICLQVLIYPMLDDRTGSTIMPPPFIGRYLWTPDKNRFGWTALLGVPAGSNRVPLNSVPARVANLSGLPPTFIGVGSIDLFVEEDILFASRLIASGVPTQLEVVPGAFHGFEHVAETRLGHDFERSWNEAIRCAFSGATA